MIKFPFRYLSKKSQVVDIIAQLKFCLSGRGREAYALPQVVPYGYETQMLSALKYVLSGQRDYRLLTDDLKSRIFITAGKQSVTCGYGNNTVNTGLKSRIFITVGERSTKGRTKTQNV
ncbi:MAG: hypothetical protein LBR81_05010 [Prevotellaceae bacterium]|jgi:hypothetical protein|nr:hypothetical protein [Prevotellaceae bacterium]